MSLNPEELARQKFEEIIKTKKDKDEAVDAIIWAAVALGAGMGLAPVGIDIWAFIAVATTMVVFIGLIYEVHLTNEGAAELIRHIFMSVGWVWGSFTLGMKFFIEVLKGIGIITMGGTTVVGMALDAALSGGVLYALGFTTKEVLRRKQEMKEQMTRAQIKDIFVKKYNEGKEKIAESNS